MSSRLIKNFITAATPSLVALLSVPLAILPLPLSRLVGEGLGLVLYAMVHKSRQRALENISASLPSLAEGGGAVTPPNPSRILRRAFAHYGRSLSEVVKVYLGLGREILEDVEFRGDEHYRLAKEKGRGIIFVTGHCGNWELLALAFGLRYENATIVVRHQLSEEVTRMLGRLREKYGNRTINRKGAARKVVSTLRQGQVVAILADIAVKPSEGVLTPFLGRPAWTTPLPAVIASKTGCSLIPVFIHREGDRHVVEMHPAVDATAQDTDATTAILSRCIENHIARYPHEWLWLYRRWKGTEPRPSARR